MKTDIIFNTTTGETSIKKSKKTIRNKGKSNLNFPNGYTVIDIETTGLSPEYDDIIEVSAIKVLDNRVVSIFSSLVKPKPINNGSSEYYVNDFITELTGITNDMLSDAPVLDEILEKYIQFIGNDVIVGHNVNFDINFIYDNYFEAFGKEFKNDFCDLLRISKHLFPNFKNHKLNTLAEEFQIAQKEAHRGLADCETTFLCFEHCKKYVLENDIDLSAYQKTKVDLRNIQSDNTAYDETHPLFNKYCAFTGTLEAMKRADAAQIVVNLGGHCENNVTQKTNYLILGNNDYCKSIKDGKSAKQKKAESLILNGQDLSILPETTFYDLIRTTTIEEAKNTVMALENSENAAFLFADNLYWYIAPCMTEEVSKLENSNGDDISENTKIYSFNQFTREYAICVS